MENTLDTAEIVPVQETPAQEILDAPNVVTVDLDEPIARGTNKIETLTLRRPNTGSLRGLSLMDLAQMNVSALQRLLPRITEPVLTEMDVAAMSPADLTAIGVEVAGFLLSKKDRLAYR